MGNLKMGTLQPIVRVTGNIYAQQEIIAAYAEQH